MNQGLVTTTETAIGSLVTAASAHQANNAGDSLKYSQAALNLAHVLQVLAQTEVTVKTSPPA